MKKYFAIISFLIIGFNCNGQLNVDAGDEFYICSEDWTPDWPTIGGDPTASGGVEPYTYIWSTEYIYPGLDITFWASSFLDDTTSANPRFISAFTDTIVFNLTVVDSIGNTGKDSILVWWSSFGSLLIDCYKFIDLGDSTRLFSDVFSIRGDSLSYLWSPNYNISDVSIEEPIVWPDADCVYFAMVTDPYGCSTQSQCRVYVNPLSIDILKKPSIESRVFPNPIDNNSVIEINDLTEKHLQLNIYNSDGKLILYKTIDSNPYRIGNIIKECGQYFYTISSENEILLNGQFVRKKTCYNIQYKKLETQWFAKAILRIRVPVGGQ